MSVSAPADPIGEILAQLLDMQARTLAQERVVMAVIGEVALAAEDPLKTLGHIRNAAAHGPKRDMPEAVQPHLERMLSKCEAAIIAVQKQRGVGKGA